MGMRPTNTNQNNDDPLSNPDSDSSTADGERPQAPARAEGNQSKRESKIAHENEHTVTENTAGKAVKLDDLPIIATKHWYITLSAAVGLFASVITATYFTIDYGRIKPIEKDLEEARALLSNAKAEALNAKTQLDRFEQKYSALAINQDRPSQIFPADRSSIVGLNINFLWDYGKHDSSSKYIFELQDISGKNESLKLNVDRPEMKRMFIAFDQLHSGTYIWRIRPGVAVPGREIAQGPWSSAAVFTIHASITDRITSTGKLLVATTPTSYDPFVGVNRQGQYDGFELKLLQWLIPRLGEKLQLKRVPNLEIVEVPWNQLFTYMQNGEADIAVRSITRSEAREREYQNLRFTMGYLQNHQIFVQLKQEGNYPTSLKSKIVGVKNRSVNESAAKFLAQKHGFNVNSSFTAYADLYEGLRRGDIAFALVDSSLVNERLNKSLFPLGGFLDNELREFYKKELGYDREEYSILVHEGGSDRLRTVLNEIIQSPDYDNFVRRLGGSSPSR